MAGYFVWLDVASVNQNTNNDLDPATVQRLITVSTVCVWLLPQLTFFAPLIPICTSRSLSLPPFVLSGDWPHSGHL